MPFCHLVDDIQVLTLNIAKHFPTITPLLHGHSTDIHLKTLKEMPDQKIIDIIVDQLNDKSNHFYKLPFELVTLRERQRKD